VKEPSEEEIREILRRAVQLGYEKEMEILEDAYKLGFSVGFYGHMEGVGWVGEEYKKIMNKGRPFKLSKLLKYLYEKGKREGALEASYKKSLSLGAKSEEIRAGDSEEFERVAPAYSTIPGMMRAFRPINRIMGEIKPALGTFFKALKK